MVGSGHPRKKADMPVRFVNKNRNTIPYHNNDATSYRIYEQCSGGRVEHIPTAQRRDQES